eukprot:3473666-Amphidinium_carterae.1
MQAVRAFCLDNNAKPLDEVVGFKGTLPEIGLQEMRAVRKFLVVWNLFEGTLPELGLGSMRAVSHFSIAYNGFKGALPEIGLQVMRAVSVFSVHFNRLKGCLLYTSPSPRDRG